MPDSSESHLSHFNLKIDGKQAAQEVMDDLLDFTVENSLHLPDLCTIRVHDAGFRWLDADTFREGTKMEVFGGEEGPAPLKPLFCGEVTALEMDLAGNGVPSVSVRCLDYSHRLQRGRLRRSFVQMTDTDIVKKIGAEANFTVHADSAPEVHDWIFQNNQTNWEFLSARAERNGFRLFVQNEKDLYFQKVQDKGTDTLKLEWGKTLRSFRPRTAAAAQVDEVIVRGWDPKKKQAIVGRWKKSAGVPQVGQTKSGSEIAQKAYGTAQMVVVDRPVQSQSEADDLARSICDEIGAGFLEAEGLCYGQPGLRPGMTVSIENIGKRFSGQYLVSSTTHTYTPAEGYSTLFSISGKGPNTLLALLEGEGGERTPGGGNIVVGVVTDNNDPDNRGRVKVKYPHLTEDHASDWARLATPMAGPERGFEFLPEIDDEVLVAFEHGDIHRPYVIGTLWNGKDKPPYSTEQAVQGGKVVRRIIRSRTGHRLFFLETPEKRGFAVKTADDNVIELRDSDHLIRVQTKAGHKVDLDDSGDKILIEDRTGQNKITISSRDNSISMNCLGDFSVTAAGNISLTTAQQFSLTAGMGITLLTPVQMEMTIGGMMTQNVGAALSVTVGGALSQTAGGVILLQAAGAASILAGGALALTGPTVPITGVVPVTGSIVLNGKPMV